MDTIHLSNMVNKTTKFESEYSPKAWRKTAGFTTGDYPNGDTYVQNNKDYKNMVMKINNLKNNWISKWANYYEVGSNVKQLTFDYINDGAAFVQFRGHGGFDSWSKVTNINGFAAGLNNSKTPFINAWACATAHFDNPNTYLVECLGEFFTRNNLTKGAVGYCGTTRSFYPCGYFQFEYYFVDNLFDINSSNIAGSVLLTSKLQCGLNSHNQKAERYAFNLLGDPALNGCCMRQRDISSNYWGENFVHNEDIYPAYAFFTDSIWYPSKSGTPPRGADETLYQTGLSYFSNEDFPNAEAAFKEVIETYPDSRFAIAAMHELFALQQFTNNDFYNLYAYYDAVALLDSNLFDIAEFLKTRCHIKEKNWQPAIDWYENRIENPPSYQDSIFAVIDLGNIHLLMEQDTLNTRGKPACT